MSAHPRGARPWRANALLALATLGVLCALLELGVRIGAPQPLFAYRFSPVTWYEPTPGARFTYARSEFRTPVQYSSLGLRDVEHARTKPPGVRRIVVIGDSFTEALEVSLQESVARRLEQRLLDAHAPVEVINLGVSGFSTAQSIARLDALGFSFWPDDVVYLASPNDFADNLAPNGSRLIVRDGQGLRLRALALSSGARALVSIKDALKHHSMAFQFVRDRLRGLRGPAPEGAAPSPPPTDAELQTMRALLELLASECEAHGARLWATMVTPKDPGAPSSKVGTFADLCARAKVRFVDLTPAFGAAKRAGEEPFYRTDGHWNATGHDAAARALATALAGGGPG